MNGKWMRSRIGGFDSGTQLGCIAQEVEQTLPEPVKTDKDGYKSMDYPDSIAGASGEGATKPNRGAEVLGLHRTSGRRRMQMSLRRFRIGVLSLLLPMAAANHASAVPDSTIHSYRGTAFDTERNIPAYTEERREHFLTGKLTATQTLFTTSDGKPMADLHLDFVRFPFKPDYAFKDLRNGYEEGAKVDAAGVRAYFRDSARAPMKEKTLKVPEPCVINGGVGEFVKGNWGGIVAGKRIPFNMVVPARLDYYKFVAYMDPKFAVPGKETGNTICKPVVIEPKNSLLAMLLPTIVMYYDPKTMRMIRYQGIVNVADAKGRSLRVRVDYPDQGP